MIRGAGQPFKFTTPFDFKDICNIEAVFSQPYNEGTVDGITMPIRKYYNKQVVTVGSWDATGKDPTKTYYVDTKYYRYDSSNGWVSSDTMPTETNITSGAITVYPLSDDTPINEAYKCGEAYYQYNPNTQEWDITTSAPSTDAIAITNPGVDNVPSDAYKNRIYVFNQCYYQHNGASWDKSDKIYPIVELDYWNNDDDQPYDTSKTYCAEETYYKYIDGEWCTYGKECMQCTEVVGWNPDEVEYDKAKIYMLKELYYQYNATTNQFENTGVREVYYKYNVEDDEWEECEAPDAHLEEIDLWIDEEEDDKDVKKTYVCKNVYYRYDADEEVQAWIPSNNMLIPVVEISEWKTDGSVYYDPSKIYTITTKYYQYNIEEDEWEEKTEAVQPKIVKLDYWTEPGDRDKNQIYLCGQTYYQYDSANTKWQSSPTFNMQLEQTDYPPTATSDQSKVYECSPIYYAHDGSTWVPYKKAVDAVRNDGFTPVDGDPKSFVTVLTGAETMRFSDKYKGRVQVTVLSDNTSIPAKSLIVYFPVYPTMSEEIFDNIPSSDTEAIRVLDAGEII